MCNNKCIRDLILFKKKRRNRFIEVICVTCIWKFTDSFFFPIIKTLSLLSLTSYHKQMTYYIKPQMVNLEKKITKNQSCLKYLFFFNCLFTFSLYLWFIFHIRSLHSFSSKVMRALWISDQFIEQRHLYWTERHLAPFSPAERACFPELGSI